MGLTQIFKNMFSKKAGNGEPKSERPITLRIAVEKGFVTEEKACEYEDELNTSDLDPEETHSDLMIDRDLLTVSQAEVIAHDVKAEDPEQALADRFKKASKAMKQNVCGAEDVGTKTQGLRLSAIKAAKNQR